MSETVTTAAPAAVDTTAAPVTPPPAAAAPAAPVLGDSLITTDATPVDSVQVDGADLAATADAPPDYSALTLPEGFTTDGPVFTDFTAAAAEHGIKPEAAQALIDKVLPGLTKQIADLQAEPLRLATERLSEWTQAVMADPEIGGAKLAEVKTTVARAMTQFGNPDEIKSALNETGAGSNPVLIKWFNRMASALSEGAPVKSGSVPGKKSGPEVFYDHPNSQPNRDAVQ